MQKIDKLKKLTVAFGLSLAFIVALTGCGFFSICDENYNDCIGYHPSPVYEPIYLSYAELRSSVVTDSETGLTDIGKIYLYKDHIFVNSRNKGIHIYDNRDPANPIHMTFIKIPGNIDIAIKSGYLYVDSYTDLVVIDLTDAENIRETFRIENVFPYNVYQNIPDGIYLNKIDQSKGIVVGYHEVKKS